MKSLPILEYNERIYFLELRVVNINEYKTFEIINWKYNSKENTRIAYWELFENKYYRFVTVDSDFLNVDSIALSKYMRIAQKMLNSYLGEMRRLEFE